MKKICDFFCNPRNLALFVAGASLLALCSAWIMQYGFDILPCHLCYMQRRPYLGNIALGLLSFLAAWKYPRAAFALLLLAGFVFLVNSGLAFYHFGTEQKWWPLGEGCGGEGNAPPLGLSLEELQEYFRNRPMVRCDVPGFVLFGISLTGYNFLLSTFLAAFTFFHAIKGRKA
jgi:disulfide bond formation protein DsbB